MLLFLVLAGNSVVSIFMKLHALTLIARSYVLLEEYGKFNCPHWCGVVKDFYIPAKLVSSRAHNNGWLEEEHVTTLKPGGIYGHYKKIGAVL